MSASPSDAGATEAPTDDELMRAARDGDAAALETLLVRYQPHLYRFGLRMCGNAEDAGDVTQESLMSMARAVRDFRGDSSVSSWLYTIARRFCLKKRRRSKFAPTSEESLDAVAGPILADRLADPAPGPERLAANRELERALITAIDALDPAQREVLVLRDVEGLSAPEVAKALGISVDAVKSRLHRARVDVRRTLAPILDAPARAIPPSSPACPDVPALFSRYLEGEIAPEVCADMEAHLARCPHCRGACDSLKRVLALCQRLPTPDVPASLSSSIRTAIQAFLARH
jgi:RNA polymerase sigma-70 factor (ECF subfamily)